MDTGKITTYRKGDSLVFEVTLRTARGPVTVRSSVSSKDANKIRDAVYAWVHQHNRKALAVAGVDTDDVLTPSFDRPVPRARSPKGALARVLDPDATMEPDWDAPRHRARAARPAAYDPDAPLPMSARATRGRHGAPQPAAYDPDAPLPMPDGKRAAETIRPDFGKKVSAHSPGGETISPFRSSGEAVRGWISGEERDQIAKARIRGVCLGRLATAAMGFGEFYLAEPETDPALDLNPKPDAADITDDESFVDDASHEDAMKQLQDKGNRAVGTVLKDTMYGTLDLDETELGQWKRLRRLGKKIRGAAAAAGRKFVPGRDKKKAKLVKQTYSTLVVRRANFLAFKAGRKKPTAMETMLAKAWAKQHLRKHGLPTTISGDDVRGVAKKPAQQDVADMPTPPSTLPADDSEIRDVQKILYAMSVGASSTHVRHWERELSHLDTQIARTKKKAAVLRSQGRFGLAVEADREVLDLEKRAGDYRLKLAQAAVPGSGSNIMGSWWNPFSWFAKKSKKALDDAEPEAPSRLPGQDEEQPAEAPAEAETPTETPTEDAEPAE